MLRAALLLAALALELSSVLPVIGHDTGSKILAWVLLQHAAASALLVWFVWDWLPMRERVSRMPVIALLFTFAFFVPVFGLPGIVIAARVPGPPGLPSAGTRYASVIVPEFVPAQKKQGEEGVHLAIKSFLDMAQLPMQRRLKSLLALQGVPSRIATRLLHDMLGDTSDDIRLLAYGFLDGGERKIAKDIDRELTSLAAAQSTGQRLFCLRQLAESYWELAYSGMAQGDLRTRVLDQALHYADEALAIAPADYGILFLRGRMLQEMNRVEEAYQDLQHAIEKGLPESRALPYIAEIQFRRHDYEQVRASLLQMSRPRAAPAISGVIAFWAQSAEGGHVGHVEGGRA